MKLQVTACAVLGGVLRTPGPAAAQLPDIVDISRAQRLTAVEVARIGGNDSREPYTFSRISAAAVISTDEVALVDFGTRQVRIFGRDATFQRRFGREGQGPGEFSLLEGIAALSNGRILAFDGSRRRLSLFERDGAHVSTHQLGGSGSLVGAFPDGAIVLRASGGATSMMSRRPGPFRDSVRFVVYKPDYRAAGASSVAVEGPERMLRAEGNARRASSKLFEPSVVAAVANGDLVFASTAGGTLLRMGSDGQARSSWALRSRQRRVPADVIRAERERRIRELSTRPALPPNLPGGGPPPETYRLRQEEAANLESYPTFPEFRSLLAGSDGTLWLEDYPVPGASGVRWYRLQNGVATGWVDVSGSAVVLAIGYGLMIQVVEDDLGVDTAVVLRLEPAAG
jgi:hypothetical protein